MLKMVAGVLVSLGLSATACAAQALSPQWEELTSADFVRAVQQAQGVCILPMGSVEKFGPSAPLGTNEYLVRLITRETVKQEYAVIFPGYVVANTTDTSTLPGTIHYSMNTQLQFLDETTHEMSRNGCKKIILANGHSGNMPLISLYMSNFAAVPHDYAVYTIYASALPVNDPQLPAAGRASKPGADGHGGEERVAALLAYNPELIHLDRAHDEPSSPGHGPDDRNSPLPAGAMTGLPTGYSGDAAGATATRGRVLVQAAVAKFVKFVRAVKADNTTLAVQQAFSQREQNPQNAPAAK